MGPLCWLPGAFYEPPQFYSRTSYTTTTDPKCYLSLSASSALSPGGRQCQPPYFNHYHGIWWQKFKPNQNSLRHTLDSRQSFEERWTLPQIFVHGYKLIRSFDGNYIRLYFVDPGVKTQISHNFLFLPLSRSRPMTIDKVCEHSL